MIRPLIYITIALLIMLNIQHHRELNKPEETTT